MPVNADPNDLIPFVLRGDRSLPKPEHPVFHLRSLTCRELRQVNRLIKTAYDETDDDKAQALLEEAIAIGLVYGDRIKCRGDEVDVRKAKPHEYLSDDELWELAYAVQREPRVKEADRRNLSSPPVSAADSSAPGAPAANATATTASPSPSNAPPAPAPAGTAPSATATAASM